MRSSTIPPALHALDPSLLAPPQPYPVEEYFTVAYKNRRAFPIAQQVKNPPAMQEVQEIWVQSLGQEDPLEYEMATHSSILAWNIPWTEEPGGLQSMGWQKVGHD